MCVCVYMCVYEEGREGGVILCVCVYVCVRKGGRGGGV